MPVPQLMNDIGPFVAVSSSGHDILSRFEQHARVVRAVHSSLVAQAISHNPVNSRIHLSCGRPSRVATTGAF